MVHLGSRAVGGASLVIAEATAVEARGRISPHDAGIWSDALAEAWAPIARFIKSQGSVPGMQIAHAGRKASTRRPWEGGGGVSDADGGWTPVGPGFDAFTDDYRQPHALTSTEIADVQAAFAQAAVRADRAGFEWIEIHAAHGYLAHSFLSPLANHRTDGYGGSFDKRVRFLLETVQQVRTVWTGDKPLTVRLSCTDWADGGWGIDDSVELAKLLGPAGVDLIDCSSGGVAPGISVPVGPGYQVPFARAIREQAGIATGAVGLITDPSQADEIVRNGDADMVFLAREMLRDPYWPLHAARVLGQGAAAVPPVQYQRAF